MKTIHLESAIALFNQLFSLNESGFGFRFSQLSEENVSRTLVTGDDNAHFGAIRYENKSKVGLYIAYCDDPEGLKPEESEWVIQFSKSGDVDDMISALEEAKSILAEGEV